MKTVTSQTKEMKSTPGTSTSRKALPVPDPYQVILFPLSTEKSIRQIEFENTLTFVVNPQSTKQDVKKAVERLLKVKVAKVNIQNAFTGQKRAYVKLSPESVASDVSAELGMI